MHAGFGTDVINYPASKMKEEFSYCDQISLTSLYYNQEYQNSGILLTSTY